MMLKSLEGKPILINDENVYNYKKNLSDFIMQYEGKGKIESMSLEEAQKLEEFMNQYNQIIDIEKEQKEEQITGPIK